MAIDQPIVGLPRVDLLGLLGEQGECRFDPELHTGPDAFEDEPLHERRAREDAAKSVCESCPVVSACLEYALTSCPQPQYGVWAGFTARELSDLRIEMRAEVPAGEVA